MGKVLNIIVVDDKAMITDLFESYIKLSGTEATVRTFNDSNEALDYINKKNPIDVIITDYKMPGINGMQLLEASPKESTRILISGYVSTIAEERLNKLDAMFFEKPVPMKRIGKILAEKSMVDI